MPSLKVVIVLLAATGFSGLFACKSSKNPSAPANVAATPPTPRVLVFSKTAGYYHTSIPAGMVAIQKLGAQNNVRVDTTRDAGWFVEDSLKQYAAVIFLSTTQNVLNEEQQVAFQRYIQAGGGFVGIHAAADTEYDWPWYNKLVGAWFLSHPRQQNAVIEITDTTHPATKGLPARWQRFDEWYNYKNLNPDVKVLANLDEASYEGGANGDNHPIAWYHEFDGGRAFYTGLGHTDESFSEPLFLQHLLGGITYAMGNNQLDYSKAYATRIPEDNRFTKTVLVDDLNEPMELAVAPDGRVFFTERAGKLYVYEPATRQTRLLHNFPAKAVDKYLNGLIGVTLDPDFASNSLIYFFYSSNTGEQYHQNISRFRLLPNGNLDTTSEKVIIKVPIDLEVSAHTGGSLAWDSNKNLYIATGDNTVPFQSNGYAPLDEREGRHTFDAQRSAANPNDLRGKILRIHPEPDGSYTVPDGNLFAKGTPGTRPEIYIMGCRNPYRISVDQRTNILYWGEIGPDAGNDSRYGPRGYDEFNQARQAGNYGWPYFVGNNIAYHDSDFATRTIGDLFDVRGPQNNSVNNTGAKQLPPPQSPIIWYPYSRSAKFPDLGDGGRCAMGGPVYQYSAALQSPTRLPAYYDKSWFIYDWMRNWVFAVHFDENNNYQRMDRFMETNGDFRRPVDIEIGPDGVMYMLEYGSVYGIDNVDARLVRIDYNGGNRAPVARIAARDTVGLAPLKVAFSSRPSYDFDEGDNLTYSWNFDGKQTSAEANPTFTFARNGIYKTVLTVRDSHGKTSTDTIEIKVGNTRPVVSIEPGDNSTFFFPTSTGFSYKVLLSDNEDASVDPAKANISLKFIPKVASNNNGPGHQQIDAGYSYGLNLINSSDCKACHQVNAKSVGPSYMDISKKYYGNPSAIATLANKIITGGAGVWGEHAMSAHPQISREDATEIVKYIVAVSVEQQQKTLPANGNVVLNQHLDNPNEGRYVFTASYTDGGGALVPLTTTTTLVLRPSRLQAEDAGEVYNLRRNDNNLSSLRHRSYFVFRNIDLKQVDSIGVRYAAAGGSAATLQLHSGSKNGPLVASFNLTPTGRWNNFNTVTLPLAANTTKGSLYFVLNQPGAAKKDLATIDWVQFIGGREELEKIAPPPPPKKPTNKKTAETKKAAETTAATTAKPVTMPGIKLVAAADCKICHSPDAKMVGPSYKQIAAKYKSTPANINKLAAKIIQGGAGNWGQVPMAPHPQVSTKDARLMVEYILSFRK